LLDSVTFEDQLTDYSWGRYPDANEGWYNMDNPTPLAANQIPSTGQVYFSRPGGTFTSSITVELSTLLPSALIYYTEDGSEPTSGDTLYATPISITETTWLRARAYEPGFSPSPINSKTYIEVEGSLATFNSNIPIVIVDSKGVNLDEANRNYHDISMVIIDTDPITGTANILDPAEFAGIGGMHIRGASSSGEEFLKKQYKFETWDENRPDPESNARYQDKNVSILGMPSEGDWILHAPWADKSHMKNYQMFAWSREIGNWSPRCVFVEAFIDWDGDNVIDLSGGNDPDTSDYRGIYVLMEKIKRDDNRVNIARLEDTGENDAGYLFQKNWGYDFETSNGTELIYDDPREDELSTAQKNWIENHFETFETALYGGNYDNPGHADYYGNYIDIDSFVNYHMLVELCKDVDGHVLSNFIYKEPDGKIFEGPLWDLNGSLGASYFCSYDWEGWLYEFDESSCTDRSGCGHTGEGGATFPADNPRAYDWYNRLMQPNSDFLLRYADNWFHFRELEFDATKMMNDLDYNADILMNYSATPSPVSRNFTLWDILDDPVWPDLWAICHSGNVYYDYTGGYISSSDNITITKTGGGTIKYTTDGTDPMLGSTTYSGSFNLPKSTQIKARIDYGSDVWTTVQTSGAQSTKPHSS
jgi:hypothetical protein